MLCGIKGQAKDFAGCVATGRKEVDVLDADLGGVCGEADQIGMSAIVGTYMFDGLGKFWIRVLEFSPDAARDVEGIVCVKDGVGAKVFGGGLCPVCVGVHFGGADKVSGGIVLKDKDREELCCQGVGEKGGCGGLGGGGLDCGGME